MRLFLFLITPLLVGIQTLPASELDEAAVRVQTRFLRVVCEVPSGQELAIAYFPERQSMAEVMKKDPDHWSQVAERCLKKSRSLAAGPVKWSARPVETSAAVGGISEPCSDDHDCKHSLSCEPVGRSCIPAFRISNLPLSY